MHTRHTQHTQRSAHSTQHTAHSTQHTAHSTQHTAHSTQHTAHKRYTCRNADNKQRTKQGTRHTRSAHSNYTANVKQPNKHQEKFHMNTAKKTNAKAQEVTADTHAPMHATTALPDTYTHEHVHTAIHGHTYTVSQRVISMHTHAHADARLHARTHARTAIEEFSRRLNALRDAHNHLLDYTNLAHSERLHDRQRKVAWQLRQQPPNAGSVVCHGRVLAAPAAVDRHSARHEDGAEQQCNQAHVKRAGSHVHFGTRSNQTGRGQARQRASWNGMR